MSWLMLSLVGVTACADGQTHAAGPHDYRFSAPAGWTAATPTHLNANSDTVEEWRHRASDGSVSTLAISEITSSEPLSAVVKKVSAGMGTTASITPVRVCNGTQDASRVDMTMNALSKTFVSRQYAIKAKDDKTILISYIRPETGPPDTSVEAAIMAACADR